MATVDEQQRQRPKDRQIFLGKYCFRYTSVEQMLLDSVIHYVHGRILMKGTGTDNDDGRTDRFSLANIVSDLPQRKLRNMSKLMSW